MSYLCPYCLISLKEEDAKVEVNRDRGGTYTAYRCNNYNCDSRKGGGVDLPQDFFNQESKIISLAGGVNSGKSNYITVLSHELANNNDNHQYLDLSGRVLKDGLSEKTLEKYANSVYGENPKVVDKTQLDALEQWQPIVLKNSYNNRCSYLSLFDTAGEEFCNTQTLLAKHPNISNSSGIILLIDLFSDINELTSVNNVDVVSSVAGALKNRKKSNKKSFYTNSYRDKMKLFRNRLEKGICKNKLKVAICISKYDLVIKEGYDLDSDYAFNVEDVYSFSKREIDWHKIDKASENIETFLKKNYANLKNTIQDEMGQFDYKFFGVSSFHVDPDNPSVITDHDSKGVIMPLLWLLK